MMAIRLEKTLFNGAAVAYHRIDEFKFNGKSCELSVGSYPEKCIRGSAPLNTQKYEISDWGEWKLDRAKGYASLMELPDFRDGVEG